MPAQKKKKKVESSSSAKQQLLLLRIHLLIVIYIYKVPTLNFTISSIQKRLNDRHLQYFNRFRDNFEYLRIFLISIFFLFFILDRMMKFKQFITIRVSRRHS